MAVEERMERRTALVEWPTMLLLVAIYGSWLAITYAHGSLPLWVVAPVAAILVAWHSSCQHEILHGHPTRSRLVNKLLGMPPLTLWLPYERYKQTHLLHHIDDRLTDPLDDPESYYWTREDFERLGPAGMALVRAQTTLAGRVVIGPLWAVGRFWLDEARAVIAGRPGARRIWIEHLVWCIPVVWWITVVCGMPLWLYAVVIAYPATGLMLVRSFAEHKAKPGVRERVAIVENSWFFGPLFLFNNLHALHHEQPTMPWYRYLSWYRENRERLIRENGGLVYNTYFDVARRFLLWSHDTPQHPLGRAPRGGDGA